MAAESQNLVAQEANRIVADIKRISGGGSSVTYGQLMQDEQVEQTYEAVFGTLKAARKRGIIDFEGELLLSGRHDAVVISIKENGNHAPAGVAAEPAPAETAPAQAEDSAAVEEAAAPEPAPAAETAEETAAPEPAPAAETAEETAPATSEAPATAAASQEDKREGSQEAASWKVDTSYINHRTDDCNRLEAKGDRTNALEGVSGLGNQNAHGITPADMQKDEDGKWKKVDTGHIDHRTKVVDNRAVRATVSEKKDEGPIVPGQALPQAKKTDDGKWASVDVGYINHRTGDCDNLEPRRNSNFVGAGTSQRLSVGNNFAVVDGNSATAKKDDEGKWKVDTAYIGYRTKDTNNLDRKLETQEKKKYADPAETKYSLVKLQGEDEPRPDDVDPAQKEQYLSAEEFQAVFGHDFATFNQYPKWKQANMKKAKGLW